MASRTELHFQLVRDGASDLILNGKDIVECGVDPTHTYEATGVKGAHSSLPSVMSRGLSCEHLLQRRVHARSFRRSLSISCEPGDGSDTYARSRPHDLAIRAG